jgi:[histone H3]-lysine4 N-trimethyltransferase SETD1
MHHSQHDEHSSGPSPPTGVLLANLSPLTNNANLKRHLTQYGHIIGFESKIDPENGTALGLVHVRFASHTDAKQCVEKENGRRGGLTNMVPMEEWCVVYDGEGKVVETCMKMLEEKKREERSRKLRLPVINGHASLPPKPSGSHTPQTPSLSTPTTHLSAKPLPSSLHHPSLPSHASTPNDRNPSRPTHRPVFRPYHEHLPAAVPDSLRKAREEAQRKPVEDKAKAAERSTAPLLPAKPGGPSPAVAPEPKKPSVPEKTEEEKAAEREKDLKDLASVGKDYIHVQFPPHVDPCSVKESKIRPFFDPFGLTPDKVSTQSSFVPSL